MSKFLISCGGTGGHLSPGISLAEGLTDRGHEVVLLISTKKVDARLAEKYPQFKFLRVPGSAFGWSPWKMARCVFSQAHGFLFSLRLVRRSHADAVVGFGGFTSAAIVLAGRLAGVRVAVHESNRVPGRAVRLFGRFADRVYLPLGIRLASVRTKATRHVGMPVRREIKRLPRATACEAFGLDPGLPVLAVFGGSQGAAPLNQWVTDNVEALALEGVQICCVTGMGKGQPESRELRSKHGRPVRVVFMPFCDRVADLLSAADLVLSRAGAGTLAELIRCETPAILVPYPQAADDHQRANAAFFERQGGGVVVDQMFIASLRAEVLDTIFNDWLLRRFRTNLQRMDRANSLDLMLRDLEELTAPPARRPALAVAAT
ncbi:UDP-N-acetylglucosamine--N-acetylmuramyl-(pentapeptide) pyrophosphoryl-undecaprenol N-acetylglucosamine transferase [Horticoccus luteus]|uniref:UDP-N-acetylglucosamine--N-acetylmuramyl-(pentapeptide) pyrophosphoryl-undecaprenol N-acetylglucosamine transferase n=1 Tax=Horticoccus luteus TaxID=2862869 RepID=A0A8F9TU63_9BACT|nr:UDP-N-acetylglucosamine--N-acetylmuramyl-(pentapeptide) pyrophosphoryl-undecaprenol N-acetylglucosamine transferase [Horticoccus luteus]QYM78081.1 UDP-N-acetylglucosamine--N-acetylmuramyl-(pentapeptide) pyrophosphoryl-undecaprenol N-acetylglucosamine transferase [Horticoccus luteus]